MTAGVKFSFDADILDIVLDRPQRRNALGLEEWQAIEEALDQASAREIGIIRLAASGPVFCGGVDLSMIRAAEQRDGGMLDQIRYVGGIVEKLERSNAIVVAALNGPAIGIGVHLALCADFIIATEASYLWLPEASMNIPDVQHLRLLTERLGRGKSFAFALLGEKLNAQAAFRHGLFYTLLPDASSLSSAQDELVKRLQSVTPRTRMAFKRQATKLMNTGSIVHQLAAVQDAFIESPDQE